MVRLILSSLLQKARIPSIKFPRRMKIKPGAATSSKPFSDSQRSASFIKSPFVNATSANVAFSPPVPEPSKPVTPSVMSKLATDPENLPAKYARKLMTFEEMEYIEKGGPV